MKWAVGSIGSNTICIQSKMMAKEIRSLQDNTELNKQQSTIHTVQYFLVVLHNTLYTEIHSRHNSFICL